MPHYSDQTVPGSQNSVASCAHIVYVTHKQYGPRASTEQSWSQWPLGNKFSLESEHLVILETNLGIHLNHERQTSTCVAIIYCHHKFRRIPHLCHHNHLMYFTSIIFPSWPAAAHAHTDSSAAATVPHRHRLLKCPVTKRFVPLRGANQLDSPLMSPGLLTSSSPLTMSSIHKHHSAVRGFRKHVCSSPVSTDNQPVTQRHTKLNFSLTQLILFPFAHDWDHISTTSCVYLRRDSLTLLCAQQSGHCAGREQESVAGSLSLPARGRKIHQHVWKENNTNVPVEMF